ncbi:MerR family transcriptional regulator [Corynebacterium glyciniphilum]|uniref:MerR family transcriptional regulator n=1 Tax=Corynebacterium glyciniphilum TaxID=1404244 RepID=UPI0011AB665A|nr:MerR family transcriptional regulator [Corynebacterium glyciniphilum]
MAVHGSKIGQVADDTGMSIRTLRHYDELGIVSPSGRSAGGFRLYSDEDMQRILLIRRMKPLDFTLEEIGVFLRAVDTLASTDATPADKEHASQLIADVRSQAGERLEKLRTRIAYAEEFLTQLSTLDNNGRPQRNRS